MIGIKQRENKMSVYKRLHLIKSLFKATIVFMLLACALCYQIGYQRGVSYASQKVSDELLEVCEARIIEAENSCVD